eukprot:TRINITY_DN7190_c0_g1_i2.p1 TRINITY_DN7190_c0_g1~~TRINITY_DN7190_c0_g1_i2.p1  ORF type:complete len:897 (+),score=282.55 TRINITY_DN7190_c0_g1_i2:304-2994(+)
MDGKPTAYQLSPRRTGVLARLWLYFVQTRAMLRKNFLLTLRGWKVSTARIVVPVLFILVYGIILRAVANSGVAHPPVVPMDINIPKCTNPPCRSLVYHPANNRSFYDLMEHVARHNDPPLRVTPFGQAPSEEDDIVPVDSIGGSNLTLNIFYGDGKYDGVHTTLAAVMFFDYWTVQNRPPWTQNSETYPVLYEAGDWAYQIVFNDTTQCPFLGYNDCPMPNNYRIQVQASMEQAIASQQIGRNVTIRLQHKDFPSSSGAALIVSSLGILFLYLAATFSLVFILNQVTAEKESGMRGFLKIQGLKDEVVWVSWFVENILLHLVAVLIFLGVGYAFSEAALFRNTDFAVLFVICFCYGLAMIPWALAWTTVIRTTRVATIVGFLFFAFGLILSIVSSIMQTLFYQMYSEAAYKLMGNAPAALAIFPPFHFCKLLVDVQTRSLVQFMSQSDNPVPPGFRWEDLYHSQMPEVADVPTASVSLGMLVMNFVVYSILAWYLDKIIPDNHKATLMPWFMFTPTYWGFYKHSLGEFAQEDSSLLASTSNTGVVDDDLMSERMMASERETSLAMQVRGLGKTYRRIPFLSLAGDVRALRDFHFGARVGQLVCVLGHNGAGKTTLLSILTGKSSGFTGEAYIFNRSVRYQMTEINEFLGVCPQFDCLWPELTAREHLEILSQFKLASCDMTRSELDSLLNDVRLLSVADQHAGTFSGGMKRRLSVAISTVGNPKIIFMDEPTTGMDPQNRRYVWELLQRIKQDKVIVLTTHSMEEADALGEKIGIMAEGQLRGIGNSLHLKQKFGSGYRLSFIADITRIDELKALLKEKLPSAKLEEENAGSLVYSIRSLESNDTRTFFYYLQSTQLDGSSPVRDWGMQNTTLEDVFMAVAHQSAKPPPASTVVKS